MDREVLEFYAGFAYPAVKMGSCASPDCIECVERCLSGEDCAGMERLLQTLPNLTPYRKVLEQIAVREEIANPEQEAARAYILGSDILAHGTIEDLTILAVFMSEQGHDEDSISSMLRIAPKPPVFFHLYQVLTSILGTLGEINETALLGVNSCMVRWGTVVSSTSQKIEDSGRNESFISVKTVKVVRENDSLILKPDVAQILVPSCHSESITEGESVAIHKETFVRKLTENDLQVLQHWTMRVLEIFLDKDIRIKKTQG